MDFLCHLIGICSSGFYSCLFLKIMTDVFVLL